VPDGKRRALGQHFLRDAGIARAIVDLVAPTAADLAVEIGPGQGALTGELARRAGRVLALEVDRVLVERVRAAFPAVEVLAADARAWDWTSLARPAGGRALVVGNLPYSVGTTILTALTRAPRAIDAMALMLQREVAERVAAAPGSKVYGSLSVHVQLHWRVELALRVPPGAFRPPPKVESAVLRLAPLPRPRLRPAPKDPRQRPGGRAGPFGGGHPRRGYQRWGRSRTPGGNLEHSGVCRGRPPVIVDN
jgi:16S rRNA (adenine1518-N6/adenine1519-N6)-dimethyltransferase